MSLAQLSLKRLGDETWGRRLERARLEAHLKYREVAILVSQFTPVSRQLILNMEGLAAPPKDDRRRYIAFLMLIAYGFDPTDFDIDATALPDAVTLEGVVARLQPDALPKVTLLRPRKRPGTAKAPSIPWYYGTEGVKAA